MSNSSCRKVVVIAVGMGLLVAALSGGAMTYASFTDSGSVDVTFTTGNITSSSDANSETESTEDDDETDQNGSNTTENETSLNGPEHRFDALPNTGFSTTSALYIGLMGDRNPTAGVAFIDH